MTPGAFVPGEIVGDRRTAAAISALWALVLDLDKGEDLDVIERTIRSKGLLAFVYSTHSHMSSTTEIKIDDYREGTRELQPSPGGLRRYLADKKGIDPKFLKSVDVQEVLSRHAGRCGVHRQPCAHPQVSDRVAAGQALHPP